MDSLFFLISQHPKTAIVCAVIVFAVLAMWSGKWPEEPPDAHA